MRLDGNSHEHWGNTTSGRRPRPRGGCGASLVTDVSWPAPRSRHLASLRGVSKSQDGVGLVLHCCLECAPKVVHIADVQPLKADTESTCGDPGLAPLHRDDRIVWVHDHRDPGGSRYCFLQNRQTLLGKIQEHETNARHVGAWPG